MRPSRILLLAGSALAVVAAALVVPASATPRRPAPVGTVGGEGIFTERCGYVTTASIDPILMPGMTGMSMAHDFFGNRHPTAGSTAATLSGGPTSCSTSADSSAYWTPVLYQHGVALRPLATSIYWRAPGKVAATVATMPAGISMIAGDERATQPQGRRRVVWDCVRPHAPALDRSVTPQTCPSGARLRVVLFFPSCWDGHALDGARQTNVVYPGRGDVCPADHPVRIPQLVLHVTYPTSSAAGLALSTGSGTTGSVDSAHADFLNAFRPAPLAADVARCLDARVRCGRVTGPDAQPQAFAPTDRRQGGRTHRTGPGLAT